MSRFGSVRFLCASGHCPHRESTAFAGRNHPAGRVTPDYVDQWQLRPDGAADPRRWLIGSAGTDRRGRTSGAEDPHHRALLLERLSGETPRRLPDVDAWALIAGPYRSLHVPAMPQLRTLRAELDHWRRDFHSCRATRRSRTGWSSRRSRADPEYGSGSRGHGGAVTCRMERTRSGSSSAVATRVAVHCAGGSTSE
jgi:hypothetical protein